MSDAPPSRPRRPTIAGAAFMALLLALFAYKLARWHHGLWTGSTPASAMTASQWLRGGFYHVAVLAGIAGLIGMARDRAGPPTS